ncbi:TNF receptor-associated factor 3-like [Rhipicephalus sanguineus]|uniref:TNF receptor-associated factor 3-like n=1 Tax=Rhipicephalus sanguineus TaxID=34632 RepID=UPI0020C36BE9|nr:TNF receptor-associated factor 3-like [Rhipicephalus sanguineus]
MPDLQGVHRFRDHAVAGVNWRPTRFVDEVPSSRVCGLCRMIPKRIMVLPCGHLLCHSCLAANSEGCGGRCPLDQEPFEEAECVSYDLPTRKANALKVHCWNKAHGCEFEGAVEFMLRHYENECTFHTVECLRCGEEVLHKELSRHYAAVCSAAVSSTRAENASSDSQVLTIQDVTAALEELKALLRDANHEQLLLAIQSQMNELSEQIRNQEHRDGTSRDTEHLDLVAAENFSAEPE